MQTLTELRMTSDSFPYRDRWHGGGWAIITVVAILIGSQEW